jgi:hypothetical protein
MIDVSTIMVEASLYFLRKTTDTFTGTLTIDGSLQIGTSSILIDSNGYKMSGAQKQKLTMRPTAIPSKISGGLFVPTPVDIGAYTGYSLPNYSADEELFYKEYAPGRWDGTSDVSATVICCLGEAEDVSDRFALQLSWQNKTPTSGTVPATVQDVSVVTLVATGSSAQYSLYKVNFNIDVNASTATLPSDIIGYRLRKVVPGGTATSGEIVILDFVLTYTVDKMYKSS